jgi:hypothetical protein
LPGFEIRHKPVIGWLISSMDESSLSRAVSLLVMLSLDFICCGEDDDGENREVGKEKMKFDIDASVVVLKSR